VTDRQPNLSDAGLGQALADLGAHLAYPPTPDLARSVGARLARDRASRPAIGWLPRLALAFLAVVLVVGAALAALPTTRAALAGRLGLAGVTITHLPFVPSPTPTATPTSTATGTATPAPTATPGPPGASLSLGDRVSLAEARSRVTYPILVPTDPSLGAPDAVYYQVAPVGGEVALAYRARPDLPSVVGTDVGLLVVEFQGTVGGGLLGKGLGPGTRLQEVTVNGDPGYWIEGSPHFIFYQDASGNVQQETIRLAGNTLIWQHGDRIVRIESSLDEATALRIATSLR
jgi:hypothetical protein